MDRRLIANQNYAGSVPVTHSNFYNVRQLGNYMRLTILAAAMVAATTASAVSINNDGTGQTLLSPYYTVQNGNDTLISIVNTTDDTKALKIRFRESYNSRDVLDFNIYMSPYDVWTAGIVADGKGAKLITSDTSCTVPAIPPNGVNFRPYAYNGQTLPTDGSPTDISRVREGHYEVIEMGVADVNNLGPWDHDRDGIADSTHENGVPQNCRSLIKNWTSPDGAWFKNKHISMLPPTGGIYGNTRIINVQEGTDIDVPVTALSNFTDVSIHTDPGTLLPNLSDAKPVSAVIADGKVILDTWKTGEDAVSAVLMANVVSEEFSINSVVDAETSWVFTFPTKTEYVNTKAAKAPFSRLYNGGSCEQVSNTSFDREEDFTVDQSDVDFSPMPPGETFSLCYETNVLNFGDSDVLGSKLATKYTQPFVSGWSAFEFDQPSQEMVGSVNTYKGLPIIGFKATKLGNTNVGVGASYASSSEFKYGRAISTSY